MWTAGEKRESEEEDGDRNDGERRAELTFKEVGGGAQTILHDQLQEREETPRESATLNRKLILHFTQTS